MGINKWNENYVGALVFGSISIGSGIIAYALKENYFYDVSAITGIIVTLELANGILRKRRGLEDIIKRK